MSDLLDPKNLHAPDFSPGEWLNTENPLTSASLLGQVVLVDFWDYTCANCIRTLPYLRAWHQRYFDKGLSIIGVHAPEFAFGRSLKQIDAAMKEFGIEYPVFLDNDYETWQLFANRYWPSKYLIDIEGYIRYHRHGEGYYQETERAIQSLLSMRDSSIELPPLLEPIRAEDTPGAVCYRPTPELHTGFRQGALGNPEGYAFSTPVIYKMPLKPQRREHTFYAEGIWQAEESYLAFAGQDRGSLVLPYSAAGVNAVLSPSGDPIELMLDLIPARETLVEVLLDGAPLGKHNAGSDVVFDSNDRSLVNVTRPRMYELVLDNTFDRHELELVFRTNGLAIFAFTFASCLAPHAIAGQHNTLVTN